MATLIRYARIDLGIEIDLDTTPLGLLGNGLMSRHWTVGTIHYGANEEGYLLYIKSSMTGDEVSYVTDYRNRHREFPHESTADQFFDEAQFEAYRALGYHSMQSALRAAVSWKDGSADHRGALKGVSDALGLSSERFTIRQQAIID
jgi:hypothetical protein